MDFVTIPATDTVPAEDGILLNAEDLAVITPWMTETLAKQPKSDDNDDLCQTLSALLDLAARRFGTPASTPKTCICHG
ncbi:hypothetical protein GCM10010250_21890 [Streptomyces althioticus]|uniref:hypothetical protein n=1 Tax=Streptomyces althioticus TaxID=83380 RepID=UPI0018735120|nr:hypothetical protein GCM10010250_21890 [Streptomyces althioticus]